MAASETPTISQAIEDHRIVLPERLIVQRLSLLQAALIECGATALFLFFTIGTITSGMSHSRKDRLLQA